MNGEKRIRKALREIMEDGQINAAQVFKGHAYATPGYGWMLVKFGENAQYLGATVAEALAAIEDIAAERKTLA